MRGLAFGLSTPHGRMLDTVLAGTAEFGSELIPSACAPPCRAEILALVAQGRSYRLVGRELGLSKNTVAGIVRRKRAASAGV